MPTDDLLIATQARRHRLVRLAYVARHNAKIEAIRRRAVEVVSTAVALGAIFIAVAAFTMLVAMALALGVALLLGAM